MLLTHHTKLKNQQSPSWEALYLGNWGCLKYGNYYYILF